MKKVFNNFILLVYATIILFCNPLNINSISASEFIFNEKSGFLSNFEKEKGKVFSLSDFKDKVLLVNLWATWCEPCKEEMPSLDDLQTMFSKDEFIVMPINLDRGPKKKALDFFEKFKILDIETFFDDKNNIPREVKILGLPVTLLINKSGAEVARLIGPAEWTDERILKIINDQLSY
jgi:thiol-disulfide isomerase/thioredoxin